MTDRIAERNKYLDDTIELIESELHRKFKVVYKVEVMLNPVRYGKCLRGLVGDALIPSEPVGTWTHKKKFKFGESIDLQYSALQGYEGVANAIIFAVDFPVEPNESTPREMLGLVIKTIEEAQAVNE